MNPENCRILHVANDYPYPPNHGGRVDIWRRVQELSELGCKVDLLTTLKHASDAVDRTEVRRHCHDLRTVDRQLGWRSFRPGIPYQWASRRSLSTVKIRAGYQVVLIESEHCAPVLSNPAAIGAKKLLRVHNDESDFLNQLGAADSNWARKTFYQREARLFRKCSEHVFNQVDHLLFSSSKQHREWVARNPGFAYKAHWIPPSASARYESLKVRQGRTVLFVGGLSSPSNQEGIIWFLENVHRQLLNLPGYELAIVGRTREEGLPPRLKRLLQEPAISLTTDAPDLEPYYARAAVFINPMQTGASIKVKTVNALEHALPTVSTEVGNEGTGFRHGEHLLIADNPGRFSAHIGELIANPQLGFELAAEGLRFIHGTYDHKRLLREVLESL